MIARFWQWIDSRSVVRRAVLFTTLWMTWGAFKWAALFAVTSTLPGLDRAAVIAAVVGPISALQGYVFSAYTNGRSKGAAIESLRDNRVDYSAADDGGLNLPRRP